ncbi:MAG TPA: shikimate dehydrogenase [Dehalococcoidia bacterium]|nr:shikimate dehydrogenase [Dehalococcoidia bacterium]
MTDNHGARGAVVQEIGLLGYPLGHSVSPVFQQAALDYLGLPIRYHSWQTPPDSLRGLVERLRRDPQLIGMNVTVPYKEMIVPFLDELEPLATRIGAVNTVYKRAGRLVGANTDAAGFLRSLREEAGFETRDAVATLLGAGGAARAVATALLESGVAILRIANRTRARAVALAEDLRTWSCASIVVCSWEPLGLGQAIAGSYLLINATSMGLHGSSTAGESPMPGRLLNPGLLVCDLVYKPPETPLLAEARSAGARTLGGLGMLVEQGALAFERWTGYEAPRQIMRAAAERALAVTV